jgi:PAS domain S-box-containing protein
VSPSEYRILVLEANPSDADAVEVQLHKVGIQATNRRVGTKELFLKAMTDFKPDVVVANSGIPRFDVLAALTQAKREHPEVSWVLYAATPNEDLAVNCMKHGAVDYINKKNLSRLGAVVKQALESQLQKGEETTAVPQQPAEPKKAAGEPAKGQPDELYPIFRAVIEQSNDLIAVLNFEGKRIYNNPAYARILEEPESLRGTDSFLDVHPEDRERVKRVFHESLRTGTGKRIDFRLLDMDGSFRYMQSQGNVLKDAEGKTNWLAVVSRDVTEWRKAELAWEELVNGTAGLSGDQFFNALVKDLAAAMQVRYALVSEAISEKRERVRALAYWAGGQWAPRFEYDVHGTTCERVVLEGQMSYVPDHVQMLFPNEKALVAMKAVCYLGVPLVASTGAVIGHLFVMDDRPLSDFQRAKSLITSSAKRAAMELERRNSLNALRSSEGMLRSVLESLNDGIIMTDLQDIVKYANNRMAEMSGFSMEEMLGKTWSTLLLPADEWENLQERNKDRVRGIAERYHTQLKHKDGSLFTALISAGPFKDAEDHVIGTLGIVTEIE